MPGVIVLFQLVWICLNPFSTQHSHVGNRIQPKLLSSQGIRTSRGAEESFSLKRACHSWCQFWCSFFLGFSNHKDTNHQTSQKMLFSIRFAYPYAPWCWNIQQHVVPKITYSSWIYQQHGAYGLPNKPTLWEWLQDVCPPQGSRSGRPISWYSSMVRMLSGNGSLANLWRIDGGIFFWGILWETMGFYLNIDVSYTITYIWDSMWRQF